MRLQSNRLVAVVLPLYVAFGSILGLLQIAMPSVLQANGMGIERAGMLALLYLPFCLSALWAPLIDRFKLSNRGRRKSWVLLCQSLIVAALLAAALAGPAEARLVVAAMVVLSFSAATMDAAVDGYLAETSSLQERAQRGGVKVIGMLSGSLIGSIVVLSAMDDLGWHWTIAILAVFAALAAIPFLLHQEKVAGNGTRAFPSVGHFLSAPAVLPRLSLALVIGLALGLGLGAPRLLLIEAGFPLTTIGTIFGPVGAVAGLIGAVAGTAISRWLEITSVLLSAAALFALSILMFGLMPVSPADGIVTVAGAIAMAVFSYGALYGTVCGLAIGWVGADQAATDYSIFQSGWNLSLVLGTAFGGVALSLFASAIFPVVGLIVLAATVLLVRTDKMSSRQKMASPEAVGS